MSIPCSFAFNINQTLSRLSLVQNQNQPIFFRSKKNPKHFYSQIDMLDFLIDRFDDPTFINNQITQLPQSEIEIINSLNKIILDSLSHFTILNFETYLSLIIEDKLKHGVFYDVIDIKQCSFPYKTYHLEPKDFPDNIFFGGKNTKVDKNTLTYCLMTYFFKNADHRLSTKALYPMIDYALYYVFNAPEYKAKEEKAKKNESNKSCQIKKRQ